MNSIRGLYRQSVVVQMNEKLKGLLMFFCGSEKWAKNFVVSCEARTNINLAHGKTLMKADYKQYYDLATGSAHSGIEKSLGSMELTATQKIGRLRESSRKR